MMQSTLLRNLYRLARRSCQAIPIAWPSAPAKFLAKLAINAMPQLIHRHVDQPRKAVRTAMTRTNTIAKGIVSENVTPGPMLARMPWHYPPDNRHMPPGRRGLNSLRRCPGLTSTAHPVRDRPHSTSLY